MVPEGADAMVMVEYSERFGTDEVACMKMIPLWEMDIVLPGEDVKTGDIVLKAGTGLARRRREHWQRLAWFRFRF